MMRRVVSILNHNCRDHLIVIQVPAKRTREGRVKKDPENSYRCTVCHRRLTAGEVFLLPTDTLIQKETKT